MINKIQVTGVFVSDQDKALDFYTNALGFEVRNDMQMGENFRWIEVAPTGADVSLSLAIPMNGAQAGGATNIIFDTSDMDSAAKALKDKGVTFVQEPTAQPWGGIMAMFSDPDGNVFSLVQRTDNA